MQFKKSFFYYGGIAGLLLVAVLGCSDPEKYDPRGEDAPKKSEELTKEEYEEQLPNELFVATFDRDYETLEKLVTEDGYLLKTKNSMGENGLELAIRRKDKKATEIYIQNLPPKDFLIKHSNGNSLIFQLASVGWVPLIESVASRYYYSMGWLSDYEFKDLDFPNKDGQTALFVAKNRMVAEALKAEYYRGRLELPGYHFTLKEDIHGDVFLHQAVKDRRLDIILWASDWICAENSWESAESEFWSVPAKSWQLLKRSYQTYIWGLGLDWGLLFNKGNLLEQTPLHLAAQSKNTETVKAFMSCRWTDPKVYDINSKTPLHYLIESLDDKAPQLAQEEKDLVRYLIHSKPPTRFWMTPKQLVNAKDDAGNTPLHLAARLNDPEVYQILLTFGDMYLPNKQDQTSYELFQTTRKMYGQ